ARLGGGGRRPPARPRRAGPLHARRSSVLRTGRRRMEAPGIRAGLLRRRGSCDRLGRRTARAPSRPARPDRLRRRDRDPPRGRDRSPCNAPRGRPLAGGDRGRRLGGRRRARRVPAVRRVSVIGGSSTGKTTVSRELARRLGVPHVELDALHHDAAWQEAPAEVLRERVDAALAAAPDGWVVDGNYHGKLGRSVLERADTVVFLDMPYWL